jgi:hypothetical protein
MNDLTETKARWNLLTPYEYLFYWVYAGLQRRISTDVLRQKQKVVAFVSTQLFLFINAYTLFICVQIIIGKRILRENTSVWFPIAIIALINYFIFSYEKETIPGIIVRFRSQSEAERKRRTMFCRVYAIASCLAFFILLTAKKSVFGE